MNVTRRYRRAVVVMLGLSLLAAPAPTQAAEFVWDNNLDAYKDVVCGTSEQKFKVDLHRYENLNGPRTRICSPVNSLCNAPMEGTAGCSVLFGNVSANDKTSSVKVWDVPPGRCIALYRHSGYSDLLLTTVGSLMSLPSDADNEASSIRLGC